MLDRDVIAKPDGSHRSDGTVSQIRPGIKERCDEHIASDAANGIEMDVP
jgi:hypothetical protein